MTRPDTAQSDPVPDVCFFGNLRAQQRVVGGATGNNKPKPGKDKKAGQPKQKQIPETKILELPLLFFNWEPIRWRNTKNPAFRGVFDLSVELFNLKSFQIHYQFDDLGGFGAGDIAVWFKGG